MASTVDELRAALALCHEQIARIEQLEQTDPATTDWMREHRAGLIEYHRTMAAHITSLLAKATGAPAKNSEA